MREILVPSSLDRTIPPSLYYHPETDESVPLVVGLHTWSYDRFNQRDNYLPLCRRCGFALLLPDIQETLDSFREIRDFVNQNR